MTEPRTISLFAVALDALLHDWRTKPLDRLAAIAPRGRLAAILAAPLDGVIVDGSRAAEKALAGVPPRARRAAFEAHVEDAALAAIYDAPAPALAEVLGAAARLSGRADLQATRLDADAPPAYPAELLAGAPADADEPLGLVTWLGEPALCRIAAEALRGALGPAGAALRPGEPAIFRDLVGLLVPLLEQASQPGHAVVAARS